MLHIDPSFDPDPKRKGSYIRATIDINKALDILNVKEMLEQAAFVYYYPACEKLAKIIVGICHKDKMSEVFNRHSHTPSATDIHFSLQQLGCNADISDIKSIFDSNNGLSARKLRDKFFHEIGPTHALQIFNNSNKHVQKMKDFLTYSQVVIQCLEKGGKNSPDSTKNKGGI